MPTCPAGHRTSSDDYCDTCGLPIESGRPDEAAPAPAPPATGAQCPHCTTVNVPDALFCEACGYDFTTGTLPRSATPAPPAETPGSALPDQTPPAAATPPAEPVETPQHEPVATPQGEPAETQAQSPSAEPAETPPSAPMIEPEPSPADTPPADTPPADTSAAATPPADATPVVSNPSSEGPPPAEPWEAPAAPDPSPGPLTPHGGRLLHPQPTTLEWVAEVWIDPDWYATQGSSDALPSPGLPEVVPLRATSALIGRVSVSRNIHPDIDCEPDTGVSRRHAQVTTDGTRWWIEDLESANGTFVGPSAGPLPTMPIGRGRVEFALDQRLYVGGWTRIVIRRATEDEQQAYT